MNAGEVVDSIPIKYLGRAGTDELHRDIVTSIKWIRRVRGVVVTWAWFISATFVSFVLDPRPELGGLQSRPALVGAAALSVCFALILSWRSDAQHRALAARTESVARWMVATGVTVAFAVAVSVRLELQFSFALPGVYLILTAPSFVAIHLLRMRLARLDRVYSRILASNEVTGRKAAALAHAAPLRRAAVGILTALVTACSLAGLCHRGRSE